MASEPRKGCFGRCRGQQGAAKVADLNSVSVVPETGQPEADAGERPKEAFEENAEDDKLADAKPQEHEKEWLVTPSNRIKMVHGTSQRATQAGTWDVTITRELHSVSSSSFDVPELQDGTLEMSTCLQERSSLFDMRVRVSSRCDLGFELDPSSLAVAAVSKDRLPIVKGDIVKAVDGRSVATMAEYRQAVEGSADLTITFCHKDSDALPVDPTAQKDSASAVEFDRVEVVAMEDVGSITVPVRRVGNLSCDLRWDWYIENSNVDDEIFQEIVTKNAAFGTVVFEEGESTAYITVAVPTDPTWNVESLYFVKLKSEPKSADSVGAILGDNATLSVYSINGASFPANVYGPLVGIDAAFEPSMTSLIFGFLEHNYSEIPRETKWAVLYSVFPPMLGYITQLSLKVLVDCGLAEEEQAQCMLWSHVDITPVINLVDVVAGVAALWLVISILEHVIAVRKRMLRLGGKATVKLRSNMLSTMLQLSERARDNFDEGDILKKLETEVQQAVKSIWLASFELLENLLDLAMQTVLTAQIALTLPRDGALILMACIPLMALMLGLVFFLRGRAQLHLQHLASHADENWSVFVTMCSVCNPAILIYKRGWHFTKSFAACHADFNRHHYNAAVYSENTVWMLKHVFTLCSVFVLFRAGRLVQEPGRTLTLGSFLILLSAVRGFGSDLNAIAGIINKMVISTASVRKIAAVLNSETRRLELCQLQQGSGVAGHAHLRPANDQVIQLKNVRFTYPGEASAVPCLNLSIQPGQSTCFPAENCPFGINTLFKVISGYLLPSEGRVRLPDRWRTVYVPVTPILFDGTLMYNLRFSDRAKARASSTVWDVCRALGMSSSLIGKEDYDVGSHGCYMKFSDRVIVSIARALLHDVDLLLISSALDVLGESCAIKVLRYLRQYTQQRGLADERLPHSLRHVKTVLFTSKFAMLQRHAEQVVSLPAGFAAVATPGVPQATQPGSMSEKACGGGSETKSADAGYAATAMSAAPQEKQPGCASEKQSGGGSEKQSADAVVVAAVAASAPEETQPGSTPEQQCSGGSEKQLADAEGAAAVAPSAPQEKQPGSTSEEQCGGGSEKRSADVGVAAEDAASAPPEKQLGSASEKQSGGGSKQRAADSEEQGGGGPEKQSADEACAAADASGAPPDLM